MFSMDLVTNLFLKNIGVVTQIEKINSTNNEVYIATNPQSNKYVLKIYRADSSQSLRLNSIEVFACEKLKNCKNIKKIHASGAEGEINFSIFNYLDGVALADELDNIDETKRYDVAVGIVDFIKSCYSCKLDGYGDIQVDGKGNCISWNNFVADYIARMAIRIKKLNIELQELVNPYFDVLHEFFLLNKNLFNATYSCLVPADLNLKNIIIDINYTAKIIDLETFVAGDIHFSLGEIMAHTYGTWLCPILFRLWPELTQQEISKIRFYAYLSNLSVLIFILELGIPDAHLQRPWGNKLSFIQLLDLHSQFLKDNNSLSFAFDKLFKYNPFLKDDFGIKINSKVSDRTLFAKATLDKILTVHEKAGITRFPEITELDKTGIIAFQCVRPDAEIDEETFTVFSGRGSTREECMVSALAEGIERYCAEKRNYHGEKIVTASYNELLKEDNAVHPDEFNAPKSTAFSEDEILEWVPAINLLDGQTYYVTANTVFYPYFPNTGRSLFRYFTTGLAAGNSYIEAITHGLGEVIERDASAINLLKKAKNPVLEEATILTCPEAVEIIKKLKSANLNVIIRYITTAEIDIPIFSVICEDMEQHDSLYVSGGYGVHLNKDIALVNALNEAALSRVTTISGAREDIKKFERNQKLPYSEYKIKYKNWFDTSFTIDYQSIKNTALPTIADDLTILCNKILKAGFNKVLMVDLSKEELILPVVKVLVPGVERYSFRMTCVGKRGREVYAHSQC